MRVLVAWTALLWTACSAGPEPPSPALREPVLLKANGGWCWYQDERAIVVDGKLVFGTVAGTTRDGTDRGDVQVTAYDLATDELETFTLAPKFQSDDHDVPALLELPDGRILAVFMTHGGNQTEADRDAMYWRITEKPDDVAAWTETRKASVGGAISYANLFRLAAEDGRIYNFHRNGRGAEGGNNPHYMVSDDDGETFQYGGRLLYWPTPSDDPKHTGIDGGRPYVKYASDGQDTIHFVTTEDHPRAYDNSIYHGFIRGGRVYASDGTEVGPLGGQDDIAPSPADLTPVFEGDADHVAWTIDLHLDAEGRPYTVFSVQRDGATERGERGETNDGQDLRYYYARFDGENWNVHEAAYAGTRLYPGEDDYTGLAALDPNNPDVLFISTDADPTTGEPLISEADGQRRYEIFCGTTDDQGATWAWEPLTRDSTADNLRPIVPRWDSDETLLLWLRGEYRSYTDYDLDVVGLRL